jgi:hypothetical protein
METSMKRTGSLRFALPLALLLGAAIAPLPALANDDYNGDPRNTVWSISLSTGEDKDGHSASFFRDANDPNHWLIIDYYADGTEIWQTGHSSDPGPDGATQRIEKPDVAGMLKKAKGLTIHISASVKEGTPLAGWLESEGRGGSIRWNPADDSDKGGPGQAPKGDTKGDTGGLTPKQLASITKQINFSAKSLAAIGNSMGDGVDGVSGESAPTPNKTGGRGKGTSDGNGDSDNKDKWRGSGEAPTLGPRPDLVNPALKNKTGSSKLLAPKLLHDNKGLSHSGSTAIGKWFHGGAPGGNLR